MNWLLGLLVVVLGATNAFTWSTNRAELRELQGELEGVQASLGEELSTLQEDRDSLRARVDFFVQVQAQQELVVGKLHQKGGLQRRFRREFPELAASAWGVAPVYDQRGDKYIEYLLVPLWFTETFIIDHVNAGLYRRCIGQD